MVFLRLLFLARNLTLSSSMIISMRLKILLILFSSALPLFAFAPPIPSQSSEPELIINNRILATVNGKSITVMDVMRKMDLFLARAYPDVAKSFENRSQFYQQSWKATLNQLIDNELIIADAEKMEMKVPEKDIREAIHERFGPNVMTTLDDLGITYDEGWHLIHSEMAVQRMSWYRVHSKAFQRIGPQDIKFAFQDWIKHNPPKEEWKYQVLSIRSKTEQIGKVFAQKAYSLIRNEPIPFEALAKTLKEDIDPSVNINVSDEYNVENKDLSESHKAILCNLTPGAYSEPTAQVSRFDKSIVHRIFYLKDHSIDAPAKFDSKVDDLQDELLQKEVAKEYPLYLSKLRKQYNFDEKQLEDIPANFQPFTLK